MPPDDTPRPARPVPQRAGERLAFLDGLRGVAAVWVLLFHLGAGRQIENVLAWLPGWLHVLLIDWGYFGIAVFFVLSGFVIALSIGDAHVDGRYFARFALRRSIRLDFPYWASIAITLGILTIKAAVRPSAPTPSASLGILFAHMVYLQDFLGLPSINEVYWTLAFEIQFYLLFCALMVLTARVARRSGPARARGLVFGAAAVVAVLWPMIDAIQVRGLSLTHWHGFLLGVFTCWTVQKTLAARWLVLFMLCVVAVHFGARDQFTNVCVGTSLVIWLAAQRQTLRTWLSGRIAQFFGRISYSLYLLHVPVSGGTFALVSRTLGDSLADRCMALLLVLVANVSAAWLLWRVVERPSTALSRRLRLTG